MVKKPHILLFNPDQWRGDVLGHMGNPAAVTPNLDRWVESEAVSFRHAFCQSPVCTPSRCSFMTGWYPHVRGHRTMHHLLQPDEPALLKSLKEAGYSVWWGGKNDLIAPNNGFEQYCDLRYAPEPEPQPYWAMDRQAKWRGGPGSDTYYSFLVGKLEQTEGYSYYYDHDWGWIQGAIDLILNAPEDQPLCIYLPLIYPHPPFAVEDPWYSQINRTKLPARVTATENWTGKPSILQGLANYQNMQDWTEDRWTELRAIYYGMCARVDHQFGLVLDALRQTGIYDDTAVFFFSDHGEFAGDYGLVEKTQNTFEDCLTRVPFLVKPPACVPVRPGVRDALVELIDMPATVEALAGITPSHDHFGRSLLPLIAGETDEHRDAVFCEGGRRHGETQCMEIPSNPELDPVHLYWPRMVLQRREGPEHSKAVMVRTRTHKYVKRLYEGDELYDLRADPKELRNLIDDPQAAGVLAQMKERLLQFYLETGDVVPRQHDQRDLGRADK